MCQVHIGITTKNANSWYSCSSNIAKMVIANFEMLIISTLPGIKLCQKQKKNLIFYEFRDVINKHLIKYENISIISVLTNCSYANYINIIHRIMILSGVKLSISRYLIIKKFTLTTIWHQTNFFCNLCVALVYKQLHHFAETLISHQ